MKRNQILDFNIGTEGPTDELLQKIEEKLYLLEPLLEKDLPADFARESREHACQKLNISMRTLRRYLKKLKDYGVAGLYPKSRRDKGKNKKFSKKILHKALKLLEQNPNRSAARLLELCMTDNELAPLAKNTTHSSLYRHLKTAGFDFKKARNKRSARSYHQFEAEYINLLWQGDARHGIKLPHPQHKGREKQTYLFAWVDDFSRKILFARYYFDEKLPRLEHSFREAVLRWGLPQKIYVDNGKVYVSKQFSISVYSLGIRKIHHPPYQAWCKGKVERCMQELKKFQDEARLAGFQTIAQLNTALESWIELKHNRKINSSIGEAPNDRYFNNAKKFPQKRIVDLEQFYELFLWREKRTVNKYGKISIHNNQYRIKGLAPGEIVEVRFDPYDLSTVYVYHNSRLHDTVTAAKLNSKSAPNVPEETHKSEAKVSEEAQKYFTKLNEIYLKEKAQSFKQQNLYSRIKEDKK